MQCFLVTVYQRIAGRYPDLCGPEDYLFFPQYVNRSSAKRIIQRQFNELLKACNLKQNPVFEYSHLLYTLRHTAICMRLTLSKGKVNIYTLAKNAGTSRIAVGINTPLSCCFARSLLLHERWMNFHIFLPIEFFVSPVLMREIEDFSSSL